jgi:2-oxo-4-hydroxy-4-carboxy-5-ureidoimidazoline decarboxylase
VAGLAWFNDLPAEDAERELRACNAAARFAREVAAGRPYPDEAAVANAAHRVSESLDWAEVTEAIGAHPRIGERAAGDSAEAASSRREQAAVGEATAAVRAELAAGNRAYEERFGHVFLIRAAGRAPEEMLAELRRRLRQDPAAERAEVTGQLADITRLRVLRLASEWAP